MAPFIRLALKKHDQHKFIEILAAIRSNTVQESV